MHFKQFWFTAALFLYLGCFFFVVGRTKECKLNKLTFKNQGDQQVACVFNSAAPSTEFRTAKMKESITQPICRQALGRCTGTFPSEVSTAGAVQPVVSPAHTSNSWLQHLQPCIPM